MAPLLPQHSSDSDRMTRLVSTFVLLLWSSSMAGSVQQYYRKDGVRIMHDPFAPGMAEKYGGLGETDRDGFDPYADSVGPGIYGGQVKRDEEGNVVIGRQYQNHNPRPGPVYAGTGYTAMAKAISSSPEAVQKLVDRTHPDDVTLLVNEVTTGGANPLHMCGMSRAGQLSTALLIQLGGEVEALDTYGMTPLHRMASNNLGIGAKALLEAGADPMNRGTVGATPIEIARSSMAQDVIAVLSART